MTNGGPSEIRYFFLFRYDRAISPSERRDFKPKFIIPSAKKSPFEKKKIVSWRLDIYSTFFFCSDGHILCRRRSRSRINSLNKKKIPLQWLLILYGSFFEYIFFLCIRKPYKKKAPKFECFKISYNSQAVQTDEKGTFVSGEFQGPTLFLRLWNFLPETGSPNQKDIWDAIHSKKRRRVHWLVWYIEEKMLILFLFKRWISQSFFLFIRFKDILWLVYWWVDNWFWRQI